MESTTKEELEAYIEKYDATAHLRGISELVCPHCEGVQGDSWEYEDNEGEVNCAYCGEPFCYERRTVVTYSTAKIGEIP